MRLVNLPVLLDDYRFLFPSYPSAKWFKKYRYLELYWCSLLSGELLWAQTYVSDILAKVTKICVSMTLHSHLIISIDLNFNAAINGSCSSCVFS